MNESGYRADAVWPMMLDLAKVPRGRDERSGRRARADGIPAMRRPAGGEG